MVGTPSNPTLEIFDIAASLGGMESLATQPMTTTHHGLTPEERSRRGITDAMIRLSVGLQRASYAGKIFKHNHAL